MLQVDKANAIDITKRYIELLMEAKLDCIFNGNIAESNIDQYGLNINESGYAILAENLRDSQKRILVYNLNGRDTSINSSKHGDSSKYLKSDSNITRAIFFFFLSGFSFTNIHDSRDNRGRGRVSI